MSNQPKSTAAIVVSAPSGTGKTTLNRRLVKEHPQVAISVSHTTRQPRPGEQEGVHYHFVDKKSFEQMIIREEFLEWAEVHGNYYGTSSLEIARIQNLGQAPLLEIDVQGWHLARPKMSKAISIFILPPSLEELWQRLEKRGSDSLETRWLRLQNAYREIERSEYYNYFIVNDDIDRAYEELQNIVIDGKRGEIDSVAGAMLCTKLKKEFKNADWIQRLRTLVRSSSG